MRDRGRGLAPVSCQKVPRFCNGGTLRPAVADFSRDGAPTLLVRAASSAALIRPGRSNLRRHAVAQPARGRSSATRRTLPMGAWTGSATLRPVRAPLRRPLPDALRHDVSGPAHAVRGTMAHDMFARARVRRPFHARDPRLSRPSAARPVTPGCGVERPRAWARHESQLESSICPTRCSSTPPIRRRPALS